MIVFPGCKINLGLRILRKREDGFHDLATVFYPLPLKDALEIIRNDEQNIQFTLSGNAIDGDSENNLCLKAYKLLKKDFPELPAIKMHLHKAIPMGAGLGGGSADGAFTLKLFNHKFQLGLSQDQLISYALQLGSDCPFFIIDRPCFATGRGEMLQPVDVSLAGYQLVLVNPGIHINTGWAFSQLKLSGNVHDLETAEKSLPDIVLQPPQNWRNVLMNDFEEPVFLQHPELGIIKNELYNQGALYAAMSGSGSSVFGIFENAARLNLAFSKHYFVKLLQLPNLLEIT